MEFYSDGRGHVSYLGLSLFHTANGAYTGNILATEKIKRQMIIRYISTELLDNIQEKICHHLGMVYNGSLGIGNAGWFPPTDISGYTDTDAATAACYSDVDYVPYYYADLGAVPSDIMFNVAASGGQIYVVYG